MIKNTNLVYVFADGFNYSACGYNGNNLSATPNIDRIANCSTIMDNCVSGHPLSAPYRASLFTGKYSASTGMVMDNLSISPNHKTFADILNNNGYETCFIGKWNLSHNNSFVAKGENRLGFDNYFASFNYSKSPYYQLDTSKKIYYCTYEPKEQTNIAIKKINELSSNNKPFALFLSLGTSKHKNKADSIPSKYYNKFKNIDFQVNPNCKLKANDKTDRFSRLTTNDIKQMNENKTKYYANINIIDENVGKIFDEIENNNISNNTIFVFTSSYGECFASHGRKGNNVFYNEAIHMPFIIRQNGKIEKGINKNCFSTVDIMPTLLGLMNLPQSDESEGIDISKSITENKEIYNPSLLIGTGHQTYWKNGFEWRGLRDEQYTYAHWRKGHHYLFDNINDPYQTENLYHQNAYLHIKKEMRSYMHDIMRNIGDNFEKSLYYKFHYISHNKVKDDIKNNQSKL